MLEFGKLAKLVDIASKATNMCAIQVYKLDNYERKIGTYVLACTLFYFRLNL